MVLLLTKRLILAEFEESDIDNLIANMNNLAVARYTALIPHPYTRKKAQEWISFCEQERKKSPRENYSLSVQLKDLDQVIGGLSLLNLNGQETGELGYWLAQQFWGKGIIPEAAARLIEFAFEELRLKRIDLSAITENTASNRVAEKLGFTKQPFDKYRVVMPVSTGKTHQKNLYLLFKD